MSSTLRIKIQGREYAVRSQESTAQTQRVVEFVEQKLAETAAGQPVDSRDLTVLTLLNVAGQYLRLQNECRQVSVERLERILALIEQDGDENSGC